jgi:hypothetical protein
VAEVWGPQSARAWPLAIDPDDTGDGRALGEAISAADSRSPGQIRIEIVALLSARQGDNGESAAGVCDAPSIPEPEFRYSAAGAGATA